MAKFELQYLTLEVTNICNLNCKMCFKRGLSETKYENMSLDTFNKALNDANPSKGVTFVGLGEPLLNPDFYEMLVESKKRGLLINFVTNGTVLTEDWCKKLVDLKIDKISISFDGATKETYEAIRLGSNFEKVVDNIKMFVKIRNEMGSKLPFIRLDAVLLKQNIHELPALVMLAKELGVNAISTLHPQCLVKDLELEHTMNMDKMEIYGYYGKAIDLAKELGVGLRLKKPDINYSVCQTAWGNTCVDVFGNIYPCCAIGAIKTKAIEYFKDVPINLDFSNMVMGNIYKDNFYDVWYGKKYNKFRNDCKKTFIQQDIKNRDKEWNMEEYLALRKKNKNCKNYCKVCAIKFGVAC